jgi:prepilin-type N-terminal cleavage/methylation domain-containing protein
MIKLPQNTPGYTLIEILVGLSIIGLLFGVGYANFRSFSERQVLLNAAKSMRGDIRIAQEIALAGQKPNDSKCNSPSNSLNGYTFTVLSPSSYEIRASCSGGLASTPYKIVTMNLGATITSPMPSPNPILFKVLGQGTNIDAGQSTQITLIQTGTNNKTTITISSGGQIQ